VPVDYYRFFARLGLAALVATTAFGCAQERDPINKVQANALAKSFFVGANLNDTSDDPEFYASTTVVDVPFGVPASVFTGATGSLQRIKWEITEKVLNARLTYETVNGIDGKGTRTTNNGAVIASYAIESHFDIKRDYNPQTGEELNVIVENTSDRPWYSREYMRVDWSSNKIVSAYSFDPLASLQLDGEDLEPLEYRVDDPSDPDAPVFSPDEGYFDVTNKIYIKPHTLGGLPACYYYSSVVVGGTAPYGSCDSAEVKVRSSFWRIRERGEPGFRDYSPQEWDGARFNAHGAFTIDRLGYDRHYGIIDSQWHHLIQRYNIWQQSHTNDTCNRTAGADPHRDTDADGTEDECVKAGAGSKCDDFVGFCTIPYSKRATTTIPWHYNLNGADEIAFESSDHAAEEWDTALRIAVQAARRVECHRTNKASLAGTKWDGQECDAAFPIVQTDDAEVETVRSANRCKKDSVAYAADCQADAAANPNSVAKMPKIIALCHSPVRQGDDAMCGPVGLVTRPGDLRYHQVNVVPTPQTASPWGYGPSNADPLTGEVIQASINVWNSVTDQTAQLMVDQIRWINGEIPTDQITTGNYVQEWARAAATHLPGQSPLMTNEEIDTRIFGSANSTPQKLSHAAEIRKGMDMRKLNQQIIVNSMPPVDQPGLIQPVATPSAMQAEIDSRIAKVKGSPVEAALVTQPWLQMAGIDKDAQINDDVLNRASPLRGLDGKAMAQAEQKVHNALAEKGQCMMMAPEPNGLIGLAKIMAKKFPYPKTADGSAPSAKVLADRNDVMWNYLRGKLNYAVIAHEMGHTVGLRHNFASSWDKFNYRPQYWQLRTKSGTVTKPCTGPVADGSTCVGPRYFDPLDQDEIDQMIWMWSQTSIMDYAGDMTQDTIGIGVYDYSAARSFYADVVDVRNDGVTVPANGKMPNSKEAVGLEMFDMVDTSVYPLAGAFVAGGTHYSQWNPIFNILDPKRCRQVDTSKPPAYWTADYAAKNGEWNPVFDGHIVRSEVCDRMPVDYVDWREMVPDTSYAQLTNYNPLYIVTRRALDTKQRPRMPYAFSSDGSVEGGIPSTYQHDNGADIYEEMVFHDSLYEDRHIFDNFRRGRVNFTLYGAYNRAVSRYHGKMASLCEQYSFTHDYVLRNYVAGPGSQYSYDEAVQGLEGVDPMTGQAGPLRDFAIACSLSFDHFVRVLSRPQPGPHSFAGSDPVLRPDDGYEIGSNVPHDLDLFQGSAYVDKDASYGARPIENGFVSSGGYWNINSAGSYYEKTHAIYNIVAQGSGGGNWSRASGIDTRWLTSNYSNLYPDGVRRLLGALVTDDNALYAPRVPAKPSGLPDVTFDKTNVGYPKTALGWPSFVSPDGPSICWPSNGNQVCTDGQGQSIVAGTRGPALPGVPVDPELGYEMQKFVLFYSYIFLPAVQRNDWLDMLRVYRLGTEPDPAYQTSELVEWKDPQTGFSYLAKRFGDEALFGKHYDKGIGSKMLQWANYLSSLAYKPADPKQMFDPQTGRFIYAVDANGQPIVVGDTRIKPSDPNHLVCEDNLYCVQLRNYRGLIDFSHDVANLIWADLPCLQGIYNVNRAGDCVR
jgi:hypothetical protein